MLLCPGPLGNKPKTENCLSLEEFVDHPSLLLSACLTLGYSFQAEINPISSVKASLTLLNNSRLSISVMFLYVPLIWHLVDAANFKLIAKYVLANC